MMKKMASEILLTLLLVSMFTGSFGIKPTEAIIARTVYVFEVFWDDEIFPVIVESTSTVSGFYFSQPLKQIGFLVAGPDGTYGFTNITIPKSLLWVDQAMEWEVLMDDSKLSPTIFFNGTHTKFHLTYRHTTHMIRISGTHSVGPAAERIVGVEVGDWAKYEVAFNFTTDDPDPPMPQPTPELTQIDYYMIEVLAVAGAEITFQATVRFHNGTETSDTMTTDVNTGMFGTYYFVGANLSVGERIYPTAYAPRINSTIVRKYAGGERVVNFVGTTYSGSAYQNYRVTQEMTIYWDKTTGIMTEIMMRARYIQLTEGYESELFMHMVIGETNIWKEEKCSLGTGWGCMRIAHKEYVCGRAELYKIADEQIELVISSESTDYFRTWNIIFCKERKHSEIYLCYSREWGFLIAGLHEHRRCQFWYAFGRGIMAFGFQIEGNLRLRPI